MSENQKTQTDSSQDDDMDEMLRDLITEEDDFEKEVNKLIIQKKFMEKNGK